MNCNQLPENDYKESKIFEKVNRVLTLNIQKIMTNERNVIKRLELNQYLKALTQAFAFFIFYKWVQTSYNLFN